MSGWSNAPVGTTGDFDIKCSNCGTVVKADGRVVDGLDQHWVGGQCVCDRFEYGFFRRIPRARAAAPGTPEQERT